MGKLVIDANIRHWWEESKQGPLPEKLDDAALEFEMMLEAHEEAIKQRFDAKFEEMFGNGSQGKRDRT